MYFKTKYVSEQIKFQKLIKYILYLFNTAWTLTSWTDKLHHIQNICYVSDSCRESHKRLNEKVSYNSVNKYFSLYDVKLYKWLMIIVTKVL